MRRDCRDVNDIRGTWQALPWLALLLLGGCMRGPKVDADNMGCRTDDNCVPGYVCSTGLCRRADAGGLSSDVQGASPDLLGASPEVGADPVADVAADTSGLPDTRGSAAGGAGGATVATGGVVETGGATVGTGGAAGAGGAIVGTGGAADSGGSSATGGGAAGGSIGTGGIAAGGSGGVAAGGSGGSADAAIAACAPPEQPAHGSVSAPATTEGAVATYACSAGYGLSGASTRTCQANGTWNGTTPTCVPIDCGAPVAPANGKVSAPTTVFAASATYSCATTFILSGTATRTCQVDGTWSGEPPTCGCAAGQAVCGGTCLDVQSDNKNCGGCNLACSIAAPATAQCALGRCVAKLYTAVGSGGPGGVAVDSTSVYWTDSETGSVFKMALGGGPLVTLATDQSIPLQIVVDATNVYWTNFGGGTVVKLPLAGGALSPLASGQIGPHVIAVDATNVYWTNASDSGSVMKVALAGGAPVPLATNQYWPQSGLAVGATHVYWTTNTGSDAVFKTPKEGGTLTLISSGASASGIAVDGTHVYWAEDGSRLMKAPVTGGPSTRLIAGRNSPQGIAVDATSIYWVELGGSVMKMPLGGDSPTTLASGLSPLRRIVVDATSVYCTANDAVLKISPK